MEISLQDILDEFEIKKYFSIGQVQSFTKKCLERHGTDDDPDYGSDLPRPGRKHAYVLAEQVRSNPTAGTSSDYHNYAVVFAVAEDYTSACDVLLLGLEKYTTDVDLLSDFLLYATSSSKIEHYELCEEKYDLLKTRHLLWNWRAYDFSIEYLLDKLDRGRGDIEEIKKECLSLAQKYQADVPTNELAYIAEARIYSIFREHENEIKALEKAYAKDDIRLVRVCVCLARIYLEQKKPNEAIECMARAIRDIPKPREEAQSLQFERAAGLLITSKVSKLMSDWKPLAGSGAERGVNRALVEEIVSDWNQIKNRGDATSTEYREIKSLVELAKSFGHYATVEEEDL